MQRRLLIYEFDSHEEFKDALHLIEAKGLTFRAYTPVPEDDIMTFRSQGTDLITVFAIIGGLIGFITGFVLQYYSNAVYFPINVGGRPVNSWPAFMIICFELMILFSSLGIFASIIILNRYPRFDHAIFDLPDFNERRDRHFFLTTTEEVTLDKAIKRFNLTLH